MKKILFILIILVCTAQWLVAQTLITGKVTDENRVPLFGVTVAEKGTNNGTYSDADGNYSITISKSSAALLYSYVGYAAQEILVNGETHLDVLMNNAATELAAIEVVGSRSLNRSITNTPVPVDYIDLKRITNDMGQLDVNQLLHYLAPSFNANKQSGSDGADHVDPATLRGLGPDQTLVLINGKRQHQSSLVNIYGTRGRGNTGTDLDAIPLSSIDHIEILRDGASAQYGSDAIAGVINIVLKQSTGEFTGNINAGANVAKYRPDNKSFDGGQISLGANYGFDILNKGYLNLTADYLRVGHTNRANIPDEWYPGHTDVRNQFGQAAADNIGGMLNLEIPLSDKTDVYAFGGYNFRNTHAYAFTRTPDDSRNVIIIYPNGFDPIIQSKISDAAANAGVRSKLGSWRLDLSNAFGRNKFNFFGEHTLNASLEDASPTSFDDGGTKLSQNTTTLDLSRYYTDIMSGLNIAFGGEFRYENYQIFAGEEGSWQTYGPVVFSIDPETNDTAFRPGGSQGFPGFRPGNEVNENRTNEGAYAEAELNISQDFMVDGALRAENYSDFGGTINGKIASRFAISDKFAVRGSISTGFRAPSLAQIYFNQTFTNVQNGQIFDAVIANNVSDITKALGIPPLKQERAITGSLGFTLNPLSGFSATVDGYYVKIKDRIVLTGNFYNDDEIIGTTLNELNVTAAQFFTNAVNTTTYGADVILNYSLPMATNNRLILSYVGNVNFMKVDKVQTNALLEGKQDSYFGPRDSAFLVNSAPPFKMNLGVSYAHSKFTADVHFNLWAGLKFYDYDPKPYWYKTKPTIDLTLGYRITNNVSFNIGAVNLTNAYPVYYAKEESSASPVGGKIGYDPYETESGGSWDAVQMGFNGAFLFAKLGLTF
ncbi:MAG: TonB-dependent receptor [Chitinophagales bacterium]|nr:TonB-dependent receptor [Chitinophagales bacterium]